MINDDDIDFLNYLFRWKEVKFGKGEPPNCELSCLQCGKLFNPYEQMKKGEIIVMMNYCTFKCRNKYHTVRAKIFRKIGDLYRKIIYRPFVHIKDELLYRRKCPECKKKLKCLMGGRSISIYTCETEDCVNEFQTIAWDNEEMRVL